MTELTSETSGEHSSPQRTVRQQRPQKTPDPGFIAVGRILAPFGIKGEVKVQSLTDNPRRFMRNARLYAGATEVIVSAAREAGGFVYLRFKGRHDRNSVEDLRHRILQVPEQDLPSLPAGQFYRHQLEGLQAFDRAGHALGVVVEIIETGAQNDVLRIEHHGRPDLLVPLLADTLVSVDLDAGRIVLDPPDWR